jgi:hypothetical protein
VGSIIVSGSGAAYLGFSFTITPTTGSTYNVNDAAVATVWDFPASQSVSFWLGPTEIGSLTTDSNGAGKLNAVIPPMAGGTYTPVAENSVAAIATSPTTGTTSYTISAYFQAVDPSGASLIAGTSSTGEYVPGTGLITIQAYGLNPTSTSYDFYDAIVAPSSGSSGVYDSGLVTSVAVGTGTSSNLLQPASNGTLIFTYSPGYTSKSTGTAGTITSANGVSGYDSNSYAYYAIGSATITTPTSYDIIQSGSTGQGLTFSGLIPYTAALYPGVTNEYNVYVGSTEMTLKFTNHNSVSTSGTVFDTGDSSISYTAPSSSGLYDLNITYNGESVATSSVGDQQIVLSLTGSSPSNGNLVVNALSTAGDYEVVGYGYESISSMSLYYETYGTTLSSHKTTVSTTNGAFAREITPGTSQPAGTYSVFTVITSSGVNYYVNSSYSVSATLTLDSSTSPSGHVGSSVTVSATGLITAPGYYSLYFGSQFIEYSSSGASFANFNVPSVVKGSYLVTIEPVGSTNVVASQTFTVKANSDVTLSTNSQYAFPGELVQFTVSGMGTPSFPSGFTKGSTSTYSVTVDLNGTTFETVSAYLLSSGKLSGSFLMPNSNSGSYYELTLWANQTNSGSFTIGTTPPTTGYATLTEPFPNSQSDYLGLVSGNGALVTGISQTQIATLETDINTTLSVPISELDASVTSIQNSVAQITTSFGTMQASLNTINATLTAIDSGVATLQTTLGQVKTSLTSLNATVIALNGDTAKISTAVGIFNTTINNINASVTITNGKLATISTDLGTFTGNVTSVSNGIATIQTKLGTIQTNTNEIVPSYGASFLIEIIILVLVVIAVVFSALAMKNSRRKF